MNNYQLIAFDMDGTLWDAVYTYARIWNEVFLQAGKEVHITRESLIGNIGIPIPKILANLFPEIENEEANRFSKELAEHEPELLSVYASDPSIKDYIIFSTPSVLRISLLYG